MAELKLCVLGPPRVELGGTPVEFERRKAMALLIYLAVQGSPHSRDALATLFWPEQSQDRARAYLRRDLAVLNTGLAREWLVANRETVEVAPSPDLWLDVAHFRALVISCQSHGHSGEMVCPDCLLPLSESAALYTDDFLAGFTLRDSPEFDDWQFFQTESLRQELASVLERLVRGYTGQGEYEVAIPYARRWLALDPLHEPAQRQLMQLYAESGQKSAALRQYEEYIVLLDKELGLPPEVETTTLYEAIKAKRLPRPFIKAELGEKVDTAAALSTSTPPVPIHPSELDDSLAPFPSIFLKDRSTPVEADSAVFVARERELAHLDRVLDLVLAGHGQAVFVIGDAGRGKTVLVQEFTRRAQERQADLGVAAGRCNAYTGVGDPYLPFREILALLTGDVQARWAAGAMSREHAQRLWEFTARSAQTLVTAGPDLIDIFIPGPPLLTRALATAPGDAGWLDQLKRLVSDSTAGRAARNVKQSDLFDQYVRVIQALAQHRPLLLVLDDLQWADSGSFNLLFHLGRRLPGSRILVVGIYRQDEVALGREGQRHPLQPLIHEFQRQFGDIFVDLRQTEGRHFVEAFLESEPNRLGPAFLDALYRHTGGHALFTVEMLRGLQERGELVKDEDGRWIEGPSLNWEILPARVEGVIGERLNRLPSSLQEALKVASVEGEVFTAEVVARLQMVDEHEMVRQLSGELDKQHRLVRGQGSLRLDPGGRRVSQYRFRHILFQRYVYNTLDEVERSYLHEMVGNELERLYGEHSEAAAGELARHYENAGLVAKAVNYLRQAGGRAVRLSANEEALGHLQHGLTLLETLPESAERDRQELALQIALFAPLMAAKGYGALELGNVYARARELCEKVGEPDQLFLVLYGLWGHNLVRSELGPARELAEECLSLAQRVGEPALLMEGHRIMDETAFYRGEFALARTHFEQSFALYDHQRHRGHAATFGQDPGVALLAHACLILWQLGYPEQALGRSREAIALAEEQSHPFSLAFALCYSAVLHQYRREVEAVQELVERATTLSTEHGFVFWLAQASLLRGWTLVQQGGVSEGMAVMGEALTDWRAAGTEFWETYARALLAEAHAELGQTEAGLAILEEALAIARQKEQGHYAAELYRLKGELLLKHGEAESSVEELFHQAIEVARRRGAKSQELRAALSLSRLWRSPGRAHQAARLGALLAGIYGWFSEGWDTADLTEARVLLEQLGLGGEKTSRGSTGFEP